MKNINIIFKICHFLYYLLLPLKFFQVFFFRVSQNSIGVSIVLPVLHPLSSEMKSNVLAKSLLFLNICQGKLLYFFTWNT